MIKIILIIWVINLLLFGRKRHNIMYCGLIGYSGKAEFSADKIKMLMLFNLERGTDSTGMWNNNSITKTITKCSDFLADNAIVPEKTFIGHTRSKSIGWVRLDCAHPFEYGKIVGAHNGTLTNWTDLRDLYGYNYNDIDIDSQLIFKVIGEKNDKSVLGKVKGGTAVLYVDKDEPNKLYCYRNADRPLYYGKTDGGIYISSLENSLKSIECVKIEEFKECNLYCIDEGVVTAHKLKQEPYERPVPVVTKPYRSTYSTHCNDDYDSSYSRRVWGGSSHDSFGGESYINRFGYMWFMSPTKKEWYRIVIDPKDCNRWKHVYDLAEFEARDAADTADVPDNTVATVYYTVEQVRGKYSYDTGKCYAQLCHSFDKWKSEIDDYNANAVWFVAIVIDKGKKYTYALSELGRKMFGVFAHETTTGYVYKLKSDRNKVIPVGNEICAFCDGDGIIAGNLCRSCGGEGYISTESKQTLVLKTKCSSCNGTGEVNQSEHCAGATCMLCNGSGLLEELCKNEEKQPFIKVFNPQDFATECAAVSAEIEVLALNDPYDDIKETFDDAVGGDCLHLDSIITGIMIHLKSLLCQAQTVVKLTREMISQIKCENDAQKNVVESVDDINANIEVIIAENVEKMEEKFEITDEYITTTKD